MEETPYFTAVLAEYPPIVHIIDVAFDLDWMTENPPPPDAIDLLGMLTFIGAQIADEE